MTAGDLEVELLDGLRAYWRMRAGLAIFRSEVGQFALPGVELEYANVPSRGVVAHFLSKEPLTVALQQVGTYESTRLLGDVFLMVIASFEKFLIAQLQRKSLPDGGTLGGLQKRAQTAYGVSGDDVVRVDEIRGRRNMLMHHAGRANAEYITAATGAGPLSGGYVVVPVVGGLVNPTEQYLTYAVDALVLYGRRFP